jgi:hypothetical protein
LAQATVVRCAVRKSSVFATRNGRVAVDWQGDPASLSAPSEAQAADGPAIVVRSLAKPWRQTSVALDRFDGSSSGLQRIDGENTDRNGTARPGPISARNSQYRISKFELRPLPPEPPTVFADLSQPVEVVCNGKPVFSWEGEPRSLSLPHELIMPDDRRLFLRCWEFPYRITRIELSNLMCSSLRETEPNTRFAIINSSYTTKNVQQHFSVF